MSAENSGSDVNFLVEELVRRWFGDFAARDWPERLRLLDEVHEQLFEDIGDMDLYCTASPIFIQQLIESLDGGAVTSLAQAHIYANSASEEHRRAAGDFLARHDLSRNAPT